MAAPATAEYRIDQAVPAGENLPLTAAVTAAAYSTSAVPSLNRASPSRIVTSRRGRPSRRAMLVAAAASVGPTAVPSTNAMGQDRWPSQCATAATLSAVTITSRTASTPIIGASRENAVGEEVTAASKTSSGSSPSRTSSGFSDTSGTNGRKPMTRPATTSVTGAGMPARRSTVTAPSVTVATARTISSWAECMVRSCPVSRARGNYRPRAALQSHCSARVALQCDCNAWPRLGCSDTAPWAPPRCSVTAAPAPGRLQ